MDRPDNRLADAKAVVAMAVAKGRGKVVEGWGVAPVGVEAMVMVVVMAAEAATVEVVTVEVVTVKVVAVMVEEARVMVVMVTVEGATAGVELVVVAMEVKMVVATVVAAEETETVAAMRATAEAARVEAAHEVLVKVGGRAVGRQGLVEAVAQAQAMAAETKGMEVEAMGGVEKAGG